MTSLELNDKERDVLFDWLHQKEKSIQEEMELLKGLRSKLDNKKEVKQVSEPSQESQPKEKTSLRQNDIDSSSWVHTIKKELEHFSKPVPSGDIVKHLLQKPAMAEKGKRFITKAVTSKLWLLQERGEVVKNRENGKYVYSIKK